MLMLTVLLILSVGLTRASDPETKAREIASSVPVTESDKLRKEGVKELSVVMSGVELVLRENIEKRLDIWQFHEKDIPSVSRMRFMHRKAPQQIDAALRPYGYYRAKITESRLSDLGTKWQAVYRIKVGDRVPVNKASVKVTGPGAEDPEFAGIVDFANQNIATGQPLDQGIYEVLKQQIQSAAAQMGYFDAEFLAQEIVVDLKAYQANVTLHFSTGDRYRIGEINITQNKDLLSEDLLNRYVQLQPQQEFNAREIQRVQSDLSNTSYFKNVTVRASADDAVDRVIPVNIELTHINPLQYVYGLGYGTDTGARVRFGVLGRRFNREGHHYAVQARVSEIGAGVGASYTIPAEDPRTDTYGLEFVYEEEDTELKNYRNIGVGGNYRFRDGLWFKTYGLNFQYEENLDAIKTSNLLIPSVEWVRTNPFEVEKRLNVYRGNFMKYELRGASDGILSDTTFLQAKASGKRIIGYENGTRLIGRASFGATRVSDYAKFPLSLRFYTGGDRTVRGYRYDEVAPVNADNEVQGGKYLAEASLEYEVPLTGPFSWAAFTDYGDAFDDRPDFRHGFGLGLRWRSPIGPIRVDVGRGLDNPGNGKWRLHLGLGPDL